MLSKGFEKIVQQIDGSVQSLPPLDKWHPELSGEMDMRIDSLGRWFHEGEEIKREGLVRLFASILRYEEENGFVLVTPVEKWKIVVEQCPFIAIDIEVEKSPSQVVWVRTNVNEVFKIDGDHPFSMRVVGSEKIPVVKLRDGIDVKLNRACYYHLADIAEESDDVFSFVSAGCKYIF
ncbi:hypothetical protein EDC56_2652 [Sinobacterium caligoides]|uniref:DUF1285 domain-containing protein n=1 Tax=Sinobacterium caligoides TaxID=933926 RepID=A0A3N2DJR3_9GAMM|nr:DUF1285 domain-containing protein [Sinobacterium caligoides]ROS00018.1 hypothetical protein EDC56_2652 [Sinobacterium caligoides]